MEFHHHHAVFPQIEVTFDIDANGILNVSAKDKGTGKEQSIRIEASSGLSDAEIERMKKEAQENEEADKLAKERIEKLNNADSLVFQTEKQLKEFGDKIPAEKKGPIEEALTKLKEAHKSEDMAAIDKAMEDLECSLAGSFTGHLQCPAGRQEMPVSPEAPGRRRSPPGGYQRQRQ